MEAAIRLQGQNPTTNLRSADRAAMPERTVERPAVSAAPVQQTTAQPQTAPPIGELFVAPSVDILNVHPTVSPGATEMLITMDIPLPFGESEITESVISRYINNVNQALELSFFRLDYRIHEDTNRVMVAVVDSKTDEVLREIPPESRLDVLARIQEFVGLLFDDQG